MRLTARRFRCRTPDCKAQIYAERLPGIAAAGAQRSVRLAESQRAIGFAPRGAPGSRHAHRLAMQGSGDTVLRMIRSAPVPDTAAPTIVVSAAWAWRRGQGLGPTNWDQG